MKRRALIMLLGAAPFAFSRVGSVFARTDDEDATGGKSVQMIRSEWRRLLAPQADVTLSTERLQLSEDEWRSRLSEAAFEVLREEGTERPLSSALNDEKREGVYVCAGCNLPLFTSEMKFDSGTGWPSFFTHIPGHLGTKKDYKFFFMPRTEYHCIRCGGHQGHVFDDGPPPTGERWCNNGVALRFIPAEDAA